MLTTSHRRMRGCCVTVKRLHTDPDGTGATEPRGSALYSVHVGDKMKRRILPSPTLPPVYTGNVFAPPRCPSVPFPLLWCAFVKRSSVRGVGCGGDPRASRTLNPVDLLSAVCSVAAAIRTALGGNRGGSGDGGHDGSASPLCLTSTAIVYKFLVPLVRATGYRVSPAQRLRPPHPACTCGGCPRSGGACGASCSLRSGASHGIYLRKVTPIAMCAASELLVCAADTWTGTC